MPYKLKADRNRWKRINRRKNKARQNEIALKSNSNHRATQRERWRRNTIDKISDYYIRKILSNRTGIDTAAWPDWMIRLKRVAIKLKRKYGIN